MKVTKIFILLFVLLLLVACSSKEEDILADTKDVVKAEFEASPKGINFEKENFKYFMPDSMAIMEDQENVENSLLLVEGEQTYILFVNPIEKKKKESKVVYEATLAEEDYLLDETFENENQFGFAQVLELADNLYEVTVGVGGTKLTTVTELKKIANSAEKMMRIANSVR